MTVTVTVCSSLTPLVGKSLSRMLVFEPSVLFPLRRLRTCAPIVFFLCFLCV